MSPARARHVMVNTRLGGDYRFAFFKACDGSWTRLFDDGITEAEDRYIKVLWGTMPGWTNYSMALGRIARGEA